MPIINGTTYKENCPKQVIQALEAARIAYQNGRGYRLRIYYGDLSTGKFWGDTESGYIGRSAGPMKVPILLWNRLSKGGPAILDHCIVRIEFANKRQGGVLFDTIKEQETEIEQPFKRLH